MGDPSLSRKKRGLTRIRTPSLQGVGVFGLSAPQVRGRGHGWISSCPAEVRGGCSQLQSLEKNFKINTGNI